jgi:hypothetical protein
MMLNISIESTAEIMRSLSSGYKSRRSSDLFSSNIEIQIQRHQTFRSPKSSNQYPLVVELSDSSREEFFADIATYHSNQLPISAHIHIITEQIREYFNPKSPDISPETNFIDSFKLACIGAALGEVLISSIGASDDLATISYAACRRSLSYVVARSHALYPSVSNKQIIDRWIRLRKLTGLAVTTQITEVLEELQNAIIYSSQAKKKSSLHSSLGLALKDLISGHKGLHSLHNLEISLVELYPGLTDTLPAFEDKFDDRMNIFLKSISFIQNTSQGSQNDSFTVGYLCNKLLPGSFDHSRVLVKLLDFFPSALIWYGIFCTTSKKFDLSGFGNGLFLKLIRDVQMPFSFAQRPQCDICLDELEVLSRTTVKNELIKPIQQRVASIALAPGVDILSRFKIENEVSFRTSAPLTESIARSESLSQTKRHLEEALILLSKLSSRNDVPSPDQASITKKRPRKR